MKRFLLLALLALGCSKAEDKAAPAPTAEVADVKGRRIDVKVTSGGYQPASIDVKANEEVTLVFTRTEATECGAEVMIPSLGVKKPLPLNQPVAIPFKTDKPGEVKFACGMDMMQGKLVVTN